MLQYQQHKIKPSSSCNPGPFVHISSNGGFLSLSLRFFFLSLTSYFFLLLDFDGFPGASSELRRRPKMDNEAYRFTKLQKDYQATQRPKIIQYVLTVRNVLDSLYTESLQRIFGSCACLDTLSVQKDHPSDLHKQRLTTCGALLPEKLLPHVYLLPNSPCLFHYAFDTDAVRTPSFGYYNQY